jgi:hypothetical protein
MMAAGESMARTPCFVESAAFSSLSLCWCVRAQVNHPNAPKEFGIEYVYYKTVSPWLQARPAPTARARARAYTRLHGH